MTYCPECEVPPGVAHKPTCSANAPMQNAVLAWGDPVGTYSMEIAQEGVIFRTGLVSVFIDTKAAAEMQALLNMVDFGMRVEVPNGKIQGRC